MESRVSGVAIVPGAVRVHAPTTTRPRPHPADRKGERRPRRNLRRVPGRHAAPARRAAWETRYVRTLLIADAAVALAAGGLAFQLRFGQTVTAHNRAYLLVSLLLAPMMVAALGLTRAYESRFLFVGTDEYQRVIRAGLCLTAATAMMSYALEVQLARSYVLLALPGGDVRDRRHALRPAQAAATRPGSGATACAG